MQKKNLTLKFKDKVNFTWWHFHQENRRCRIHPNSLHPVHIPSKLSQTRFHRNRRRKHHRRTFSLDGFARLHAASRLMRHTVYRVHLCLSGSLARLLSAFYPRVICCLVSLSLHATGKLNARGASKRQTQRRLGIETHAAPIWYADWHTGSLFESPRHMAWYRRCDAGLRRWHLFPRDTYGREEERASERAEPSRAETDIHTYTYIGTQSRCREAMRERKREREREPEIGARVIG